MWSSGGALPKEVPRNSQENTSAGISFLKTLHARNLKLSEAATGDVLLKKVFLKFRKFQRKTLVLESLLNTVAVLRACNFIKKDSDTGALL